MKTFDVEVQYITGLGKSQVKTYETDARSAAEAKQNIRDNFRFDGRRASSVITKLTAVPSKVQPNSDVIITVTDNRPPLPVVEVPCKDLPQPVAAALGCPPVDDEFPIGQSVTVIHGEPRLQGVYLIQSIFNDKDGSRRITLERAGYVPNHVSRFVTITPAKLTKLTKPRDTIEYKVLYPDDRVFTQGQPNSYSSYGLDQLVQIKLTKRNGKIIKKELV